jgi:hypothetical protein
LLQGTDNNARKEDPTWEQKASRYIYPSIAS